MTTGFEFQLGQIAQQAAQGLEAHPWAVHSAVGVVFAFGIVLWLFGKKLMRTGFVLIGLFAGALIGHLLPPELHIASEPLLMVGIGAVMGAILGWLCFRIFVAHCLGTVLSIVSVVGVTVWMQVPRPEFHSDEIVPELRLESSPVDEAETLRDENDFFAERVSQAIDAARERLRGSGDPGRAATGTELEQLITPEEAQRATADLLQSLVSNLGDQVGRFWEEDLTPRMRLGLALASIGGYLVGLVLGMLLPTRAAAVTTAIVGPAVWIPSGVYLMHAIGLEYAQRLPAEPIFWVKVWLVAAVVGMAFQLMLVGKRSKKES